MTEGHPHNSGRIYCMSSQVESEGRGGADFTTRSVGGYQFFTNMYFMHSIEPADSTCVTCRQYLRHLPTVPASPANSTCVTCQCYQREHECSLSCSIRRKLSSACIECIPAHKLASESPQHTIPPNSRGRPRGECHGRAGMHGSVTRRGGRNVTLY